MADITTTAEIKGKVDGLQRSLRTAESSVKSSAAKINGTKADFKIGIDTKKLDREIADANRKIDKVLRDAERRQVAAANKAARAQTQLGKTFAAGGNPTSALGNMGETALQGLVIAKVAEIAVRSTNQVLENRAATRSQERTGNLEPGLEANKNWEEFLTSIPIVGPLGKGIRKIGERLDPTKQGQEALDILKEQTAEQDRQNERRQKSIDLQVELNKQAEAQLTTLKRSNEDRTASPTQQGLNAARRVFLDTVKAQEEASGSLPPSSRQLAVRQALGANVGRSRRAVGFARTREVLQERIEEEKAGADLRATIEGRRRTRRARAAAITSAELGRQIEVRERRSGELTSETETKALELRASGRDRQADEAEIRDEQRRAVEAANGDQSAINRANRQADARLKAIERDAVERRTQGAAGTRQTELEARGQSGAARVAGIEEELRQAIKAAGSDPELKDQAQRKAQAELKALEREVDLSAGRQRAESVTTFQDLRGRFSGPTDPNAETPSILKGVIAKSLRDIATNTAGGARTS